MESSNPSNSTLPQPKRRGPVRSNSSLKAIPVPVQPSNDQQANPQGSLSSNNSDGHRNPENERGSSSASTSQLPPSYQPKRRGAKPAGSLSTMEAPSRCQTPQPDPDHPEEPQAHVAPSEKPTLAHVPKRRGLVRPSTAAPPPEAAMDGQDAPPQSSQPSDGGVEGSQPSDAPDAPQPSQPDHGGVDPSQPSGQANPPRPPPRRRGVLAQRSTLSTCGHTTPPEGTSTLDNASEGGSEGARQPSDQSSLRETDATEGSGESLSARANRIEDAEQGGNESEAADDNTTGNPGPQVGLGTAIKPLTRPVATGEFEILRIRPPPIFRGHPESAEDENCPLTS
eukprot:591713-Prorocentrum_minimum.AAC.3